MNWLKKLLKKASAIDAPKEDSVTENPIVEEAPKLPSAEEHELPGWMASEESLRDEGVIYGITGASAEEKTKSISSFYGSVASPYQHIKNELSEKIQELNLQLEQVNSKYTGLKSQAKFVWSQNPQSSNLLRVVVGLILSTGICAGNYFLIENGLSYGFPGQSQWIAWGVFLSGMFSLYYNTSLIHNSEKLTWRRGLEEFGMPFAASLFVFVQVYAHLPWYKSSAFFLFVFFVFLLSGKLLLGGISRLKTELSVLSENIRLKTQKKKVNGAWKQELQSFENQMEQIRIKKWRVVSQLNEAEAQLTKIQADKESAELLFMSEYNLAKKYKDNLSGQQISKILGNG